jgi:hypothetical protein
LNAKYTPGQRFEIGRIVDHSGWMVGVTQLQDQDQGFAFQNVHMLVNDPVTGTPIPRGYLWGVVGQVGTPPTDVIAPLPLVWSTISGINSTRYWSIEWMYIHRTEQLHNGGYFEFFAGPRYFELDDSFNVDATGGILADSYWNTNAENHVIAGQVGARWFQKVGRWMLNAEGRFWGGVNCQNYSQDGVLASQATPGDTTVGNPILMSPTSWSHAEFRREFNPGAELRVEGRYQLTRAVSLRLGWTGMWMDRMSRASGVIDYSVQYADAGPPEGFNLLPDRNRQSMWINGFTIGLDINR